MGCSNSSGEPPKLMHDEVPNTKTSGFSGIYRRIGIEQLDFRPFAGANNVADLYMNTVKKHPQRNAIGFVSVKKEGKDQEGNDIEKRQIHNFTYKEVYDQSQNLGKAVLARNLTYKESVQGMRFIGIYAKNRYEWFVTDWACAFFGITSVPLYDTLGVQNLTFCLKQTEMTTLFVSSQTVKVLAKLEDVGNLKSVITYDLLDNETRSLLEKRSIEVIQYDTLLKEGASIGETKDFNTKISSEDCLTFCYTSGTTGPPKGAMLSHKNALAFTKASGQHSDFSVDHTDVYASYLPLPHVMERFISIAFFANGGHVICTCGDVLKLKDDCQVIKPTILLSVPRLYNRIVEKLKARFDGQTGVKKWLVNKGLNSKIESLQQNGNYKSSFYDSVVFSAVREGFGGQVRIMASGSAPLSPQTHEFMMAVMSCPLIEGYGQTEGSAGVMYSNTSDKNHGQFAELAQTVEVKLCDIPEMKYLSSDKEGNAPSPRGELWVRGPQVFLGYYKQDDVTKQTLTPDGWLKSGDIVQIMPHLNAFKIIDRKKNIFKLQQGEYIAPEKVEHVYAKHPAEILNASEIFVHGDSTKNFCVLISTPLQENLMAFAAKNGFKGTYEETIADRKFKEFTLKQLNSFAKKQGLLGFEVAKNVYFEPKQFLNKGILTNTMKLIRFEAKQYYKPQIDAMYAEGDILLK